MFKEHIATYREEASDLLAELETSLLDLEETPGDSDPIDCVFRAMHTLKGSGSMFGFDEIAAFTHEVETVFDLVRNGKLLVTRRSKGCCKALGFQTVKRGVGPNIRYIPTR